MNNNCASYSISWMQPGWGHNSKLYCIGGGEEGVGEDREAQRRKEVDDLISKYAKKKDKDEVDINVILVVFFIHFLTNLLKKRSDHLD